MKVFSLKKFIESCQNYKFNYVSALILGWPIECHGKEVIDGFINNYAISDEWTEEVNENV